MLGAESVPNRCCYSQNACGGSILEPGCRAIDSLPSLWLDPRSFPGWPGWPSDRVGGEGTGAHGSLVMGPLEDVEGRPLLPQGLRGTGGR